MIAIVITFVAAIFTFVITVNNFRLFGRWNRLMIALCALQLILLSAQVWVQFFLGGKS